MIFGFLIPIAFLVIIIVVAKKLFSRDSQGAPSTFSIRRLFQYALLFGLLAVAVSGVSGLIGRLFDSGQVIAESRTDLARDITFALVGIPLYLAVGRWTKKTLAEDPSERHSVAWNAYLSVVSVTALITSMTAAYGVLLWALGNDNFSGQKLSRFLVWGLVWIVHWQLIDATSREDESRAHYIVGSLIGLGVLSVGVGNLVASVARLALSTDDKSILLERTNPSVEAIILIIVGLPVWYQYWLRIGENLKRELLWYSYVLLAGVAGGFITLIVSSSVVLFDALVWFFGETESNLAAQHFGKTSSAVGSAVAGFAVWWYHARVVARAEESELSKDSTSESGRGEIRRVYEYIISGVSLIAAAAGLMMIMVAILESVTPGEVISTASSTNTLLVAVTLILVGSPVWWFFWQRIERHVAVDGHEQSSPTRRIFLLMLFGVASIAAVISVLTGVFIFLDDLLNSQLGNATLREIRFPVSILIANAAIGWYHWSIYRHERTINVRKPKKDKFIVLVGPKDPVLARSIQDQFGGSVQMWDSLLGKEVDGSNGAKKVDGVGMKGEKAGKGLMDLEGLDGHVSWEREKVIELIKETASDEILIINEKKKLKVIPFQK